MANDAVQAAKDKAAEVAESVGSATIDLTDAARSKGQELMADPGSAAEGAANAVRRNPVVGVAMGVLLALVLLAMLRRRRHA